MEFETLGVQVAGPVGTLTLDRPECLNALSAQALTELITAASWFNDRPEVRAVVVTGAGRAFCSGVDLGDERMASLGSVDSGEAFALARLGGEMALAVQSMRAVTVAALHGHVVGGGVVLAAACDLRVAATGTLFRIPEVEMGLPLGWGGIPLLVASIGTARTMDLVLTCRSFDATEALAMGLINRVVAPDRVPVEAGRLADTIAAMPPRAVGCTKPQVAAAAGRLSDEILDADAALLLAAVSGGDAGATLEEYRRRILGG